MTLVALALLLVAAALHTGWNLLVKRAAHKQVFTWLALCSGVICALPLLLTTSSLASIFSPQVWPLVVTSAIVETVYYLVLIRAYSSGDFSVIYPFARGTAPVFLALWNTLFWPSLPLPVEGSAYF